MMGSPSKGLMRMQGRQRLQHAFFRGMLIGLLLVFVWTCVRLMRRHETQEMEGSGKRSLFDNAERLNRQKLAAFVGVQSGFSQPHAREQYMYEVRRDVLRATWFPSDQHNLKTFEKETGVRVRFVIGHSSDATAEYNLEIEQQRHADILRLDIMEDYLNLANKILTFLRYVSTHFDVHYIVKVDDDVFFRLKWLPYAIPQWAGKDADFIGCMKRGEVYRKPGMRWMEPQHPLLGDHYYTHVWGPAYVVSGRAASFLSSIPEGSLRFLNNEDTTMGAWMLAFNVTYFDDRRFCAIDCTPSSLVVYDYPRCAGLCEPQKRLQELYKSPTCWSNPDELPLLNEIIPANSAKSRQLPPKVFFEGIAA